MATTNWFDSYMSQLKAVELARLTNPRFSATPNGLGPEDAALSVMRAVSPKPINVTPVAGTPQPQKHKSFGHKLLDVALAPVKLAGEALDTSPGRAALDILSRPTYAEANILKGEADRDKSPFEILMHQINPVDLVLDPKETGHEISDFWKGLSGQDKTTTSDVLKQEGVTNPVVRGIGGFVGDVAIDPTSYLGVGDVVKIVKGASKFKTVSQVASDVSPAKKATEILNNAPADDAVEPIVAQSQADAIQKAVSQVPKRTFNPAIKLPDLFEDAPAVAEAGTDTAKDVHLANLRAIKAMILQSPDHQIGRYTSKQLLDAAEKASPERQKQIDTLFNTEAKRVYQTGKGLPGAPKFTNAEGKAVPFGLTHQQWANLLQHGEVGDFAKHGDSATESFLSKLPIHSIEDLDNVYVRDSAGARMTLHSYLDKLGVKIRPRGEIKIPTVKKFEFKPSPKTVYSAVKKTGQPLADWESATTSAVGKKAAAYLKAAPTRAEFEKRSQELLAAKKIGEIGNLKDLEQAHDLGLIDNGDLSKLFEQFGVKSFDELRAKAGELVKKTGKLQRFNAATMPVDDFMGATGEDLVKHAAPEVEEAFNAAPVLNADQIADLGRALPWAITENLVDPQDIKKYPFLSGIKHAKRTSQKLGEGKARNLHGWHGISQTDVFRQLTRAASARFKPQEGLKGRAASAAWRTRAASMYDHVMPELRATDFALRKAGVKIISGTDNSGLMLSLSDVLESLPRPVVEKYMFNPRTSVLPTELLDAADGLVRAYLGKVPLTVAKQSAANAFKTSPKIAKLKNAATVAGDLTQHLDDAMDEIVQRVQLNYAHYGLQAGEHVQSMTQPVIDNIVQKFADPNTSIGEAFGDFITRHADIAKIGRQVGANPDAYKAARDMADSKLATVMQPGDFAGAKAAGELKDLTTFKAAGKAAAKIGVKLDRARGAEALDLMPDTVDLGDRYEWQLAGNLFRGNVPLLDKVAVLKDALGRGFVASYGQKDLHEILRVSRSVTQQFAKMHHQLMANLADSISQIAGPNARAFTQEAFKHLQAGLDVSDPDISAIMSGLKSSIGIIFGSSVDKLGSFAERNGVFADHLNEMLDYYGVPKLYRFDPDKALKDQTDAWKDWRDVEDPLDLLDRVHGAMQRALVEVTVGRDFSVNFGKVAKEPGWVKITDARGASRIGRYMDTDLYYPREIAEQIKYVDDTLKGSFAGFANPTTAKVIKAYDSIIHSWKSGVTIYHLGHHVRNLVGDVTLAMFDGATDPRDYFAATRILSRRGHQYQGWDGLKALETGTPLATASDAGRNLVRISGKNVELTDDALWRHAFDQGIIPDYRAIQDLAFNEGQQFAFQASKRLSPTRPLGGRGQALAGGIAQARDHWVRLAHFRNALRTGGGSSLEDAVNKAGARVRKWHPDGSDLTNFESKVMRRTFMFYSWMRKSIPLVVETMVMKPGRAMVFPKGMYNFAQSMGVDPDSLGNPFPDDQLFPEFLTDRISGPVLGQAGAYLGIDPGDPFTDTMNQFGVSDSYHQVGASLSPVARIPLELDTNTNLGTGGDITDKSDYLDSQLPGVSYLAKITGHSVTGFGQPTRDVDKGYVQPGMNNAALINFLTGLGLQQYSKSNYIRRAQLELRDKIEGQRNG